MRVRHQFRSTSNGSDPAGVCFHTCQGGCLSPSADLLSDTAARYAAATGAQPVFLVQGAGGLLAAKWRIPPHRVPNLWAPDHALAYRVSGISTVARTCRGVTQRKVPPIGSVTFSPGDRATEWASDAPIEAIHIYIAAHALRGFAEAHLDGAALPEVGDFFGIVDPWLAGYCQLLESDCALHGDSLFLEHTAAPAAAPPGAPSRGQPAEDAARARAAPERDAAEPRRDPPDRGLCSGEPGRRCVVAYARGASPICPWTTSCALFAARPG